MYFVLLMLLLIPIMVLLKAPAERYSIPFPLLLVFIGFVLSEVWVSLGFDTGVRAHNFQNIIHYWFLPTLVFSAAFKLEASLLGQQKLASLLLIIPVPLITMSLTAVGIYYAINHPTGFPWIAAFITGAILSATSAKGLAELLPKLGVTSRIINLLQVESVFNSTLAVVLFSLCINIAELQDIGMHVSSAIVFFTWQIGIGILWGGCLGFVVIKLFEIFKDALLRATCSLASCYFAFLAAYALDASGAVAVFVLGLMLGRWQQRHATDACAFTDLLWRFTHLIAVCCVFLLVGVTIHIEMFTERWLAMLLAIASLIFARSIAIYTSFSLHNACIKKVAPYSRKAQTILNLAGTRGAIAIALAFALPTTLPYWWTIQSICFGVVVFSLFIQSPLVLSLCHMWQCKHFRRDDDAEQ